MPPEAPEVSPPEVTTETTVDTPQPTEALSTEEPQGAPESADTPVETQTEEASASAGSPGNEESVTTENPYATAFDGYSDDEVGGLLNLVAMIRDNPTEAAGALAELAKALQEGDNEIPEGEVLQEGVDENGEPLSMEQQFEKWYADKKEAEEQAKQQAEQQAKAVEALDTKLDGLGYGRGTAEDPDVFRSSVLMLAHDAFNGDVEKAHAHVQSAIQAKVDAALGKARGAKKGFVPVEVNGGVGGEPGKKKVGTFEEAAGNLAKRLS